MPHLFELNIRTQHRNEFIDITDMVQEKIDVSGMEEGICVIFTPHTTSAITINENADPDVQRDLTNKLQELVPEQENYYRHAEGNSDSHMKSSLYGPSLTCIITKGRLLLGIWQGIYFCEFDGPRSRKYFVKIIEG